MTINEAAGIYATLSNQFTNVYQNLPPSIMAQLPRLQGLIAGGTAAAFNVALRDLWRLALTECQNPAFLRTLLPIVRPALGIVGTTWARVEVCSLAMTGALASTAIVEVLTVLVCAIIVLALVLLLLFLLKGLWDFICYIWHWKPQQTPQPMQTPHWDRLLNSLNSPDYGPLYAVNTGNMPTQVG